MGAEQRAENRSLIGSWRLGAATALAVSGAIGAQITAEAAGKDCRNTRILLVGVGFANNPLESNRRNQADPVDLRVGSPEFGIAVVDYIRNPRDPDSARTEMARGNLVNRGSYTSQVFRLTGLSNTVDNNGSEAMEVAYFFDNDPVQKNPQTGKLEKPSVKAVVRCGYTVPVWGGRSAPLSEIERALNNPGYQFRTVASVVNEAMRNVTGRSAGLGPEEVMQAEVRRALREFVDKEKAKAQALTTTPTSTPRNTETPTPTPTPTPRNTETPTPASTVAPKETPGGTPAPKPSGGTVTADGSVFVLSGLWEWLKSVGGQLFE